MVEPKVASVQSPLPNPPAQAGEGDYQRHPRRSVRLATWLSAVPGLGQLYNREPLKALIFLGAVILSFVITLNIPGATADFLAWWKPRGSAMVLLSLLLEMLSLLLFMGTFLLGLTVWYDAMHDARRTAQEANGDRLPGGRWWLFHR